MKIRLYVDFDGVILNTIEVSYQRIKEKYGDKTTYDDSIQFYQKLDWDQFLNECTPINHSIENLKKLIDSGLYDVTILTHVLTLHEQEAKERYLNTNIPGLDVIFVKKPAPKWTTVDSVGAILVDDYSKNLDDWQEHEGISIKFSLKNKTYDYLSIKNLEELIHLYPELLKQVENKKSKVKKK